MAPQIASSLYNVLSVCLDHLDVLDLISMSASSKSLEAALKGMLAENPCLAVCIAEHRNADMITTRDIHALEWLYAVVGQEAMLAAALESNSGAALLAMPNLDEKVVSRLVASGFKITHGQLVAASMHGVAGVEAFMLMRRRQGCKGGWGFCNCHCLPSLREALACGFLVSGKQEAMCCRVGGWCWVIYVHCQGGTRLSIPLLSGELGSQAELLPSAAWKTVLS